MRRVLIVCTRQIGDVLLTTPLIHEARRLWPAAAIDVLGFAGTLGMLKGNPEVRRLIEMPADAGFGFALRLWRRYDIAFVADPGDRAHLVGFIAARQRAGIVPAQGDSSWWKRRLLVHAVTAGGDLGDQHVVEEKLALIRPWGGAEAPLMPPPGAELPAELRKRLGPRYIVMHAPSMWPYKQWPLAHFRELASRLAADGEQLVLTGGPGEADRQAVAYVLDGYEGGDAIVDAGLLDFNQLATLLRGAALYIGPDTSVSHLAAACGARVLAIFGPTNPERWAPWPTMAGVTPKPLRFQRRAATQTVRNVTIVQAQQGCVPCGKAGCQDHRQSRTDCLPAITPDRVARQALDLLHD